MWRRAPGSPQRGDLLLAHFGVDALHVGLRAGVGEGRAQIEHHAQDQNGENSPKKNFLGLSLVLQESNHLSWNSKRDKRQALAISKNCGVSIINQPIVPRGTMASNFKQARDVFL